MNRIEVAKDVWESLCNRVISSEHTTMRLREANVALHKGIRRLTKKIERLESTVEMHKQQSDRWKATAEYAGKKNAERCDALERAKIVEYIRNGAKELRAGAGDDERLLDDAQVSEWIADDIEKLEHWKPYDQ